MSDHKAVILVFHSALARFVRHSEPGLFAANNALMQRLCLNRSCGYLWSRPSLSQFSQVRPFQSALRVSPKDSALPDFTYRALLVDAAGTLLIPSEPAAEVKHVLPESLQLWPILPLSIGCRVSGVLALRRKVWRDPVCKGSLVTLSQIL